MATLDSEHTDFQVLGQNRQQKKKRKEKKALCVKDFYFFSVQHAHFFFPSGVFLAVFIVSQIVYFLTLYGSAMINDVYQ